MVNSGAGSARLRLIFFFTNESAAIVKQKLELGACPAGATQPPPRHHAPPGMQGSTEPSVRMRRERMVELPDFRDRRLQGKEPVGGGRVESPHKHKDTWSRRKQ